eukprot:5053132-Amphidinium_carterae.1
MSHPDITRQYWMRTNMTQHMYVAPDQRLKARKTRLVKKLQCQFVATHRVVSILRLLREAVVVYSRVR